MRLDSSLVLDSAGLVRLMVVPLDFLLAQDWVQDPYQIYFCTRKKQGWFLDHSIIESGASERTIQNLISKCP